MRVLVAVEGSEESRRALERAIDRAIEAGDDLTVAVFAIDDQSIDATEQWARNRLAETNLDATICQIETDHPASGILEVCEDGEFDQLVIGGGTRSPMGKIQLGSITEFVLLNAQTTVRLER